MKKIKGIKELYKAGTVIELIEMKGEPDMKQGLKGTVDFVDDIGQIHMNWENGRSLALIEGEDKFRIIKK